MKFLPSLPFNSICKFALKMIPSTSKIDTCNGHETLYGFKTNNIHLSNIKVKKGAAPGQSPTTTRPDRLSPLAAY